MSNKKILLFEDKENQRKERLEQIEKAANNKVTVLPFRKKSASSEDEEPEVFEIQIEKILNEDYDGKNGIGLIVCDYELSILDDFKGISGNIILAVAEKMSIPACFYTAGEDNSTYSMFKRRTWESGTIIIDDKSEIFGKECVGIFNGFQIIEKQLQKIKQSKFIDMTPSEILATILNKSYESDRIALYGSGDQGILPEIMPELAKMTDDVVLAQLKERYPRILGNWLYTSILRFPGILVNIVAASSYLDINEADFKRPEVQSLFEKAKYKGPFSDCNDWWWRRDLDELLMDKNCEIGLAYAREKITDVRPSICCEGKDHSAGFYCMLSQEPVCEKHSRGAISWFPSGADLSRISKKEHDKIGPFLGLY